MVNKKINWKKTHNNLQTNKVSDFTKKEKKEKKRKKREKKII